MTKRILRDNQVTYTNVSREPQIGDMARGYTSGKKCHSLWHIKENKVSNIKVARCQSKYIH